jgi:hypothetical protein
MLLKWCGGKERRSVQRRDSAGPSATGHQPCQSTDIGVQVLYHNFITSHLLHLIFLHRRKLWAKKLYIVNHVSMENSVGKLLGVFQAHCMILSSSHDQPRSSLAC